MTSDASLNPDSIRQNDLTVGTASSDDKSVASSKGNTQVDQDFSVADENGSVQPDQLLACFSNPRVYKDGGQIRLEVTYSYGEERYTAMALGKTVKDVKNWVDEWNDGPTKDERQDLMRIFDQKKDPSWPSGDESLP